MLFSRQMMLNVWLIASGEHGEDLEEVLRMNSLGHNLTVLANETEFNQRAENLRVSPSGFPHLLMYLIGDNPDATSDWLRRVKVSADLRHVPVIVFHTDRARPDVRSLYALGATSVIRVPVGFQGLVEIMRVIEAYWFSVTLVPKGGSRGGSTHDKH